MEKKLTRSTKTIGSPDINPNSASVCLDPGNCLYCFEKTSEGNPAQHWPRQTVSVYTKSFGPASSMCLLLMPF